MTRIDRVIFHVDMDAFYASIEQLDNPDLKGRPVVVGGRGKRSVVAACSYESRPFGVHSAMPMAKALRLCPEAVIVPIRMQRYQEISKRIMALFGEYSPSVRAISIDEAFLDMTGTERLLGPPVEVAQRLKEEIMSETGLTISVGIGASRFIAKLASEVDKPDGLHYVPPGGEADFVLRLELRDLWGLGKSSRRRLERLGITTVADLRSQRLEYLRGHFGEASGDYLYRVARGEDPGIYRSGRERHSISSEETFEDDIADVELLRRQMLSLAEEVFHRSIRESWRGRTIHVKYRFPPFETHTVSRTLPRSLRTSAELASIAMDLLESRREGRPLRLLGVALSGDIEAAPDGQGELFDDGREESLDPTIVELRQRFGTASIGRASLVGRRRRRLEP